MHILFIIISAIIGAAIWWNRIKMVKQAGSEVADAIGRTKGKMRRNKIRKQSEKSPITAIDDPVIAAATLLYSIIHNYPAQPKQDAIILQQLLKIAEKNHAEEAQTYAKWVQSKAIDRRDSVVILCNKLNQWLNENERAEMLGIYTAMVDSAEFDLALNLCSLVEKKLEQGPPT